MVPSGSCLARDQNLQEGPEVEFMVPDGQRSSCFGIAWQGNSKILPAQYRISSHHSRREVECVRCVDDEKCNTESANVKLVVGIVSKDEALRQGEGIFRCTERCSLAVHGKVSVIIQFYGREFQE
jgi:hypothetical protein